MTTREKPVFFILGCLVAAATLLNHGGLTSAATVRFSCDFEEDLCGFIPNSENYFERRNRDKSPANNVPPRDGETGKNFIFREFYNTGMKNLTSRMTSPMIQVAPSTSTQSCLKFWLHMRAEQEHEFIVFTANAADDKTPRDRFIGDAAPTWSQKSVNLEGSFKIVLELVTRGWSFTRKMQFALDDLVVEEGPCVDEDTVTSPFSCNFESSNCGYTNIVTPMAPNFTLTNYATENSLRPDTVPQEDSTYHTDDGHYMLWYYDNNITSTSSIVSSEMVSPAQKFQGNQCLSFHYQNVKFTSGYPITLSVSVLYEDGTVVKTPWSSTLSYGYKWSIVKRSLSMSAQDAERSFMVRFKASISKGSFGMVAVDDIHVAPGLCMPSGDCDFNTGKSGYCDWQSITGEEANMIWANGLPTDGPMLPAAVSSGYIYFRGGRGTGNFVGSRAVLYSDDIMSEEAKCMTFSYFMDKTGAALITIILRQSENASSTTINLWQHNGLISTDEMLGTMGWRLAKVPLTTMENVDKFDILIEGRILREIDSRYLVAIDDVVFLQAPCELTPASALPDEEMDRSKEFSRRVCNFDDDGDNDNCGYSADESAPLQWYVQTGARETPVNVTEVDSRRPAYDHTTLEEYGEFLLFESPAVSKVGDFARQVSLTHRLDGINETSPNTCLRFWYQYSSFLPGGGSLTVYGKTANGTDEIELFSTNNFNDAYFEASEWTLASVSSFLLSVLGTTDFQLIFEAKILQNDAKVMVAIDDISVFSGECRPLECDFEEGLCGWHTQIEPTLGVKPDLVWELKRDSAFSSVMYVPIRSTTPAGQIALLRSAEEMTSTDSVCLQFSFRVNNKNSGTLSVLLAERSITGFTSLWSSNGGGRVGMWQKGQVPVQLRAKDSWTIAFEVVANDRNVTVPSGQHYDIALDNITNTAISETVNSCEILPKDAQGYTPPPEVTVTTPLPLGSSVINCTFDAGLCDFTDPNKQWRRVRQSDEDAFLVPQRTGRGKNDYFLVHNLINKVNSQAFPEVTSPLISAMSSSTTNYCIKFSMFMQSFDLTKFRVILYHQPGSQKTNLRQFLGEVGSQIWNSEFIDFSTPLAFQIGLQLEIEPRSLDDTGVLAIDDFVVETGKCSADGNLPHNTSGTFCDFEEDDCSFVNSGDVDFVIWNRTSRANLHSSTIEVIELVPSEDSTYHSAEGHYALAYFGPKMDSLPADTSKSALFNTSMLFDGTGPHCVSFFYRHHRIKNKGGSLFFSVRNGQETVASFTSNVDHGKKWIAVKRTVTQSGMFSIDFYATATSKARAAIAIDDISVTEGNCSHSGDCAFDPSDKMCSWQHLDTGGKMRWINSVVTGGPPAISEINLSSAYLYFQGGRETGNEPAKSRAVVYSEELTRIVEGGSPYKCMTFRYFIRSAGAAVLRIHQVDKPEQQGIIWEDHGLSSDDPNITNVWSLGRVPLDENNKESYLITIEGFILRETNGRYTVAVDDVQFLAQSCERYPVDSAPIPTVAPPESSEGKLCTFDANQIIEPLCNWEVSTFYPNVWQLQNGQQRRSDQYLPAFDHTTQEEYGNYLYFNSTAASKDEDSFVTTIMYSREERDEPRCLRFWYYFTGQNMGSLYVSTDPAADLKKSPVIWSREEQTPSNFYWSLGTVDIPGSLMKFRLKFNGEIGSDAMHQGGIAIDDISVSPFQCRGVDCDFEHGTCNWEDYYEFNSTTVFLDFSFATSEILPSLSSDDHGYFLYVPLRASTPPRHSGFLRHTGTIPGGQSYCLIFDYAVTNADVGWLNVWHYFVNANTNEYDYQEVWSSKEGSTIGSWQTGQVLLNSTTQWTLMFEVFSNPYNVSITSNNSKLNGIALDNIRHTVVESSEQCSSTANPSAATTQVPTKTTPVTATTKAPPTAPSDSAFDCTFGTGEGTFCGWTQREVDKYKWVLGKAGDTGNVAGPVKGDYSRDSDGVFAYIDAPGGTENDKARLFSPFIKRTKQYCVRFFYNANGLGVGNINLFYVKKGEQLGNFKPPLAVAGRSYGDQWIAASYTDRNPTMEKQFVIEAVRGSYTTAFLAVDQVSITDGACNAVATCDFENDWCGYNPINSDEEWGFNPAIIGLANHAFVQRVYAIQPSVILRSEIIPPKSKACLEFEYSLNIVDKLSSLKVWTIQYPIGNNAEPNRTLVWSLNKPTTKNPIISLNEVSDARAPLSTTNPFQLSIEAEFGNTSDSNSEQMVIDDIEIKSTTTCTHLPKEANPTFSSGSTAAPTTTPGFVIITETIIPSPNPTLPTPLGGFGCNFDDKSFCAWNNKSTGFDLTWALASKTLSTQSGPDKDVSGNGYFAFLDSRTGQGLSGRMESSSIVYPPGDGKRPGYYVLGFWYMMYGNGISKLEVHERKESENFSSKTLLWKTVNNQGKKWLQKQLVIEVEDEPIRIAFDGYRLQNNPRGLIALDELTLEVGKIPDQFDEHICDFDTPDQCGYNQQSTGFANWEWRNGLASIENNDTGPTFDKSQNSVRGYFMAIDPANYQLKTAADLMTKYQPPATEACIKFYVYKKFNTFPGVLVVTVMYGNEQLDREESPLWTDREIIGGDYWEPVFITIRPPADAWRVIFMGNILSKSQPIVAIDHVVINEGSCQPNLLYCDFDQESMCEWSNDLKSDHVDWLLTYGESEVPLTGPSADQEDNSEGGYLLFEAATSDIEDVARVISVPVINEDQPYVCFKFWYHMYGADVGALTVLQRNLSSNEDKAIWQLFGDQMNSWHQAHVQLNGSDPYQVIFEAKRLYGVHGSIAIDSITEDPKAADCTIRPSNAVPVPPLPTTTGTTFIPDSINLQCDFEESLTCNWAIINKTSSFSWARVRAGTASLTTGGPSYDHTKHAIDGHYLLVTTRSGDAYRKTRLESELTEDGTARCMRFFYHAYGFGVGSLNVLRNFRETLGGDPFNETVLWSRHAPDEGRVWQLGQVDLPQQNLIQTFIFEVVAGSGSGDIAIDDIVPTLGPCHTNDNVCDFENSRCNFEDDWEPEAMSWHVVSPSVGFTIAAAPTVDVSLGLKEGHFLMAYKTVTTDASKALTRAKYQASNVDRCFQFYYHVYTGILSEDNLLVSAILEEVPILMVNVTGYQGWPSWHVSNFHIPPDPNNGFTVQFEANVGLGSGIAIDEVSLREGMCRHPLDCQFDSESSCLWTQNPIKGQDQFDWQVVSPVSMTSPGPARDHTKDSPNEWMALASGTSSMQEHKAWLVSPTINPNQYICLSFWFYFSNYSTGKPSSLRAFGLDITDNFKTNLWKLDQTTTFKQGEWVFGQFGRVLLTSVEPVLVFEAEMGDAKTSFIALDDISAIGDTCDTLPEQASPSYRPPTAGPTSPPAPEDFEFTCDFEDGTECVFNDTSPLNDACKWVVRKGPAEFLNTGPPSDHTLENTDGHYLYFQSSKCFGNSEQPSAAALMTKNTLTNFRDTAQCLKFWYHMFGAPNVLMVHAAFANPEWRTEFLRKGNQGDRWLLADVTIDNKEKMDYDLIFEAYRGLSRFGDIALDDISMRDGACPSSKHLCDFENQDFCNYKEVLTSLNSPFRWNFAKAGDLQNGLLSQSFTDGLDHTFFSPDGHLAYADGAGKSKNTKTYMVSPSHSYLPNTDQCITFWYQLPVFPNGGKLQVYVLREDQGNAFTTPAWTVGDGFQNSWEYGTVPVTIRENFKFAFEAWNDDGSFFVLDDIKVLSEKCPTPLTCDFENGLCGWTNDARDDFEWIVFQGASSSGTTAGPTVDHTLNSTAGHYVHIDNEYPNQMNYDTAELVSQRVSVPQGKTSDWCFMFWYHMYIDSQSNASLELVKREFGDTETSLFFVDKPQRNMWIQQKVNLTQLESDFRLSFKGTVEGAHGKSDIALDDFYAFNGSCLDDISPTFTCPGTNKVIEYNQVCDQIRDCSNGKDEENCGNCKFESVSSSPDLCGYSIFVNDNFTWEAVTTTLQGTTDQGAKDTTSYMKADFSKGALRSSTFLDSPWLHETSATCKVSFWYNMNSSTTDAGALIVYLKLEDTETTIAIIDRGTVTPGSTPGWQHYMADLGRVSGEFRLVFRARKGMSKVGFIALDEIIMNSCDFHQPHEGSCPENEWKCPETQACVYVDELCDFTDNCGKGEDELGCSVTNPIRCSFDKDLCDWTHGPTDEVKWVHTIGGTSTPYSGPLRDHTTGLKNGGFAYIKSSKNPADIKKKGSLRSVVLESHVAADQCSLRFYSHMYGSTMGQLKVYVVNEPCMGCSPTEQLNLDGDYGDVWIRNFILLNNTVPFRVVFEGSIGGNSSDIAIDDVSFSRNCRLLGTPRQTSDGTTTFVPITVLTDAPTQITTTPQTTPLITTVPQTSPLTTTKISTTPSIITAAVTTIKPTTAPSTTSKTTVTPLVVTTSGTATSINSDTSSSSTERTIVDPRTLPGLHPGLGGGTIAGIVLGAFACLAMAAGGLYFVVRRRRIITGSPAVGGWGTSSYKNFGALDGVTTDETDDGKDNAVFNDFFAGDL